MLPPRLNGENSGCDSSIMAIPLFATFEKYNGLWCSHLILMVTFSGCDSSIMATSICNLLGNVTIYNAAATSSLWWNSGCDSSIMATSLCNLWQSPPTSSSPKTMQNQTIQSNNCSSSSLLVIQVVVKAGFMQETCSTNLLPWDAKCTGRKLYGADTGTVRTPDTMGLASWKGRRSIWSRAARTFLAS